VLASASVGSSPTSGTKKQSMHPHALRCSSLA
jgi:hypothetical protein